MARPEDRLKAIEAHKNGHLGIKWGLHGVLPRGWAKKQGCPNPFCGFKKTFIAKILESDSNFEKALIQSGIDVYLPSDENVKHEVN